MSNPASSKTSNLNERITMNKILTRSIFVSIMTLFALTTTQAQILMCSTKIEVGENFETNANLYERDVSNFNKDQSIIDLNNLTITNADTKNKVSITRVAENLYEKRDGKFLWRYLINLEKSIFIEASMTKNLVYVKILECK